LKLGGGEIHFPEACREQHGTLKVPAAQGKILSRLIEIG